MTNIEKAIKIKTVNDIISIPVKDILSVIEYDDNWVLIRLSTPMQVVFTTEKFDEVNKKIEEVTV